jgi:spoIIIJ-associated protein
VNNTITITGKTVEEAVLAAVESLGAKSVEDIEYTVIEEGKKGLFGIGAVPAKIEAALKNKGAAIALDFIKKLVADMQLDVTVEKKNVENAEKDTCLIEINGEDAGVLIGHHGDTLDSIQYLANLAANKKVNGEKPAHIKVTVDAEGYRAKREETLRALARRMADRVLKQKRSVMLEPMNPYERRIIHSEIQNIEGVSTNSIGSENNRKIVIYLEEK